MSRPVRHRESGRRDRSAGDLGRHGLGGPDRARELGRQRADEDRQHGDDDQHPAQHAAPLRATTIGKQGLNPGHGAVALGTNRKLWLSTYGALYVLTVTVRLMTTAGCAPLMSIN